MTPVYDALDPVKQTPNLNEQGLLPTDAEQPRRSGDDRRQHIDRRRSAQGLYEQRARREGIIDDRRRQERREPRIRFVAQWAFLSRLLGPFKSSH